MTTKLHYNKAPILEALIDLVLVPNPASTTSSYKKLEKFLKEKKYKKGKALHEVTARFQLGTDYNNFSHSHKTNGFRYESHDGQYVLQARDDRFTFSILNTYDNWEAFSEEAYKWWDVYKLSFKPKKIIRQAVKFINKIEIPETVFKLEHYFRFYPHVFDDESLDLETNATNVHNFFMQATVNQAGDGGMATITITNAENLPDSSHKANIILDIDVVDNRQILPDSPDALARLNNMREQKNKLFELSITDKLRKLIE